MNRFISFINRSFTYGGQERYLELLVSQLVQKKIYFNFKGGPERLKNFFQENMLIEDNSNIKCFYKDKIVVINGNRSLYNFLFSKKNSSIQYVYVQHSSFDDCQDGTLKKLLRSLLMRASLRYVDAIIRVCTVALPDSWCNGKYLVTVHNGVDLNEFHCKLTWSEILRPLRLLMIGSVNPNKNQKLAIETLSHLPDSELTIVGDGPARTELKDLAVKLGVAKRVHWAGPQSDTGKFYREADVYLMLSQFEAMPFVVLESMASGTPVVGFPVGGVPEVIDNGVDGILLFKRSADALASTLTHLINQPSFLRTMGEKARSKIEGGFTVQHMAEGFLRVVEEVQRRNGAGRST